MNMWILIVFVSIKEKYLNRPNKIASIFQRQWKSISQKFHIFGSVHDHHFITMPLPTPKQALILLLGLYINAGYILGAFPFRCSRRDLKVVIATGKHDMRRTGSRLSTIVTVWLFYFALAYKEIADPGVSKFGSMFKFLIAPNAWLTYLMQQNFVHRNEEVVAAINQSIKLFSNAPGGKQNLW